MNEISCDICMDLMPLVRDGAASEDSKQAVECHIAGCEACRALYGKAAPPPTDLSGGIQRVRRKLRLFYGLLMGFGIVFGVSLTAGTEMFYNTLIMPVIGALGYLIFRVRALYIVPALLLAAHFILNLAEMLTKTGTMDWYSMFLWTGLYSIFAVLGAAAAGLLHYVFRKEKV